MSGSQFTVTVTPEEFGMIIAALHYAALTAIPEVKPLANSLHDRVFKTMHDRFVHAMHCGI